MSYAIGDLKFKTKKECENYTRNLINTLGCCVIDKEHKQYIFFENLIKNHSEYEEKKGCGVNYFYIRRNKLNKKFYELIINRLDNTDIDISWVYCCQFKKRTITEDLTRAMREAVKEDIIKYKEEQKLLICNYCKSTDEIYENFHVDHSEPSFKTLKDDFLKQTKRVKPSSFGECKITNLTIFKDKDKDFKNEWVNFHNNNCNFQILCRKCNLLKH